MGALISGKSFLRLGPRSQSHQTMFFLAFMVSLFGMHILYLSKCPTLISKYVESMCQQVKKSLLGLALAETSFIVVLLWTVFENMKSTFAFYSNQKKLSICVADE